MFKQTSWTAAGGGKRDAGWDSCLPSLDLRLLLANVQLQENDMD